MTAAVADQCRAQGQTAIDKLMDKQRTFDVRIRESFSVVRPLLTRRLHDPRSQIVEKQLKSAKSGHDTAVADKQKAQARAARLKEVCSMARECRTIRLSVADFSILRCRTMTHSNDDTTRFVLCIVLTATTSYSKRN